MPQITIIQKDGSKRNIEAENGWSIMEVLRDSGQEEIEGACGGSMACATCHVYIHPDWQKKVAQQDNNKTEEEEDILDMAFDIDEQHSRLGCQIRMSDELDGIILAVPGAKINW